MSEESAPAPVAVEVTDSEVIVRLADARMISTPLVWYPTLLGGTAEQRKNVILTPMGIHWPDLDEDLSVAGMLAGAKPTYRWLQQKEQDDRLHRTETSVRGLDCEHDDWLALRWRGSEREIEARGGDDAGGPENGDEE